MAKSSKKPAVPINPWKARVEALMLRYDLNQKQLGERLGVSQANVSDWYRGYRVPPRCVQKLMALMDNGDDLKQIEKI